MTERDRQNDHEWLLTTIALEDERGSIVPGGAVGGAPPSAVHATGGKTLHSAAMRARKRVRFLAMAVKGRQA